MHLLPAGFAGSGNPRSSLFSRCFWVTSPSIAHAAQCFFGQWPQLYPISLKICRTALHFLSAGFPGSGNPRSSLFSRCFWVTSPFIAHAAQCFFGQWLQLYPISLKICRTAFAFSFCRLRLPYTKKTGCHKQPVSSQLLPCRATDAGTPAAHKRLRLVLLPSGPDTVHRLLLRRTRRLRSYRKTKSR